MSNLNIEEFEQMMIEDEYEEFELDEPVKGIYFYVVTEFNNNHKLVNKRIKEDEFYSESEPLATHPEAKITASLLADKIHKSYGGSKIINIPDDVREDIFSIYILDKDENEIACIGISAVDYRDEILH
jgi:hypothetical protein